MRTHQKVRLAVLLVAVVAFIWPIILFGFGWPKLSAAALHINAMTLIALWALGPATWFALEWHYWKGEPNITSTQRSARDFWVGGGAVVLMLAVRELGGVAPSPPGRYVVAWSLVVDVVKATTWPVVTVLGFILFREPVSAFFSALGNRASKIGAFNVSIELANLPEARRWSGPDLDELRSEHPMSAGDSSGGLFRAIADTTQADYVIVNLESGEAWLTSRLFILAALIPRVRPIKRIVILKDPAGTFVGETTPTAIVQNLARHYPWLEMAYFSGHVYVTDNTIQMKKESTMLARLDPMDAGMVLSSFLQKIQIWSQVAPENASSEWVKFQNYQEHATWLSAESLSRMLGRELNVNAVRRDPSVTGTVTARTLLRNDSDYVAITDMADRFLHLVDRNEALDRLVRQELVQAP